MLLRFTVSNFLSFSDEVEFNMFPANFKIHKSHVYHTEGGVDLLKAAAIYGANGSGKSNFIEAIDFFRDIITFEETISMVHPHFKLDEKYTELPTKLEVEISVDNRFLIYGISLKDDHIFEEWLRESFVSKNEVEVIFNRKFEKGKPIIRLHDKYLESEKTKMRFEIYVEDLKNDGLFLNRVSNHIIEANIVLNWFTSSLLTIKPSTTYSLTKRLHEERGFEEHVNHILKHINLGMAKIGIKQVDIKDFFGENEEDEIQKNRIQRELKKKTSHMFHSEEGEIYVAVKKGRKIYIETLTTYNKGKNKELVELNLSEQSDGTQRILDLIPIISLLEQEATTIFVDEIDRSLHPTMAIEFLRFLMSRKTKGQLIFTTHESHLLDLDIFRQDEIWFTEKNEEGSTKMYPLSDYKPRYDLDIQKGYLAGRFGAIPFLGNLADLVPAYEIQ